MERIVNIIGRAPSEISDEELFERLTKERERVVTSLQNYRPAAKKATRKPSISTEKKKMDKLLLDACKELGVTPEELLAMTKEA